MELEWHDDDFFRKIIALAGFFLTFVEAMLVDGCSYFACY